MKISTKEELLLERLSREPAAAWGDVLGEYEKPFFGFLLVLFAKTDQTLNRLYVKISADILRRLPHSNDQVSILLQLYRQAVRELKALPAFEWAPPNPQVFISVSSDEEIQIRLLLCLKVLSDMSVQSRAIMLLRDFAELTIEEIAYVMEIPENQIKSFLNEARLQFREKMKESLRLKDFYDLRKH